MIACRFPAEVFFFICSLLDEVLQNPRQRTLFVFASSQIDEMPHDENERVLSYNSLGVWHGCRIAVAKDLS